MVLQYFHRSSTDLDRSIVVEAGKELSTMFVSHFSLLQLCALLTVAAAGLYPRHGIHSYMDLTHHGAAAPGYFGRGSLPWILAAKDVCANCIHIVCLLADCS